jgi:hypothetical protein
MIALGLLFFRLLYDRAKSGHCAVSFDHLVGGGEPVSRARLEKAIRAEGTPPSRSAHRSLCSVRRAEDEPRAGIGAQ